MGFIACKGIDLLGKLVSQGDFPALKEVEQVLKNRIKKSADKKESKKEMKTLQGLLEINDPEYNFWTPDLLEAIDDVAVEHFRDIRDIVRIREYEYVNALTDYTKEVTKIIQEHQPDHRLLPKVVLPRLG